MISKVQSKELRNAAVVAFRPKFSHLERGILTWAILDPGDKVLDACTHNGLMLSYLHQHKECEVCGISPDMQNVKHSRTQLQHADIVYARTDDIPWKENSFDVVFLRKDMKGNELLRTVLKEVLRVLKPGGQFLLGTAYYPAPIRQILNAMVADREEPQQSHYDKKTTMMETLKQAGYEQVSWHQAGLFGGVVIGWKPTDLLPEML